MLITNLENKELDNILIELDNLKKNISLNFIEIANRLKKIKDEKLYLEKGFKTFFEFIRNSKINMSPILIDRFINLIEDGNIEKFSNLDIDKINEIVKLNPEHREKLFSTPINIDGNERDVNDLSLKEIKKISKDFKRENKFKCDRCGRWVENTKELDGKFYGTGSKHSCYDKEIEERRYLEENSIPAGQLDNVLKQIETNYNKDNNENFSLSENIYKIYGQFLYQHKINSEELSIETLEKEKNTIDKFINLLKSRLKDIKDSINLISDKI